MILEKKNLDSWLDEVDYSFLNSSDYVPSLFALQFMNFIKLVNGGAEANKTPPVHLKMLDKIEQSEHQYLANLIFRGAAKTTLFMEYLSLYLGVFNVLPGLGYVDGMIYVSDSMENGVKSARKNIEFRYNNSEFLREWIPKASFTDPYIEFTNREGRMMGIKMFGARTGIRGTKIFGKRPVLAILDDLISDDDARSKVSMDAIKDTVYKGVNHALDPTRRKVIMNGTPFNSEDILIEAVESGVWDVNVWPVCEKFPCTKEEFVGAWEDRFTYEYIQKQYSIAKGSGKLASFYQELMLRISAADERLINTKEIQWYSRRSLLKNIGDFNFYITTDFATSESETADFSVISVWAYNSNGDWYWVDGSCEKQTMEKNVDALFSFIRYMPQGIGIETNGQQGGFIPWIQREMMNRNIYFNLSSNQNGKPGIRSQGDKFSRFSLVVPLFKMGKIFFPQEMKETKIMKEFMSQISLATASGLKGKDDCLDTISMLNQMSPWRPSNQSSLVQNTEDLVWGFDSFNSQGGSPMASYIV